MPIERIRFADFDVDLPSREVLRSGQRVRLQEKSFLVLQELLKTPGRVVGREALTAALWPKEHFVDAEHGLNTAVRRLREALGDSAESPRFVETVPKLGYRFVGTIEGAADEPAEAPRAPVSASTEAPRARPSRRVAAMVTMLAVLAAAAVLWAGAAGRRTRAAARNSAADAVQELVARSRFLRNHKRVAEAKAFVEEAVRRDPRNPQAVAGLALSFLGDGKDAQAREAALRALELDPRTGEAHRVLGALARGAGDMAGAERSFRRAAELDPSDAKTRNRLARHLLECGRFEQARTEMEEARRLAPDDPDVQNIWLEHALRTGDYESAIRQGEIWTVVWDQQLASTGGVPVSTTSVVRDMLGLAYVGSRRHEEALSQFRAIDPGDDLRAALALGHAGRVTEARAILEAHERSAAAGARSEPGLAGAMAMAAIVIGDFDRAFVALDAQLARRWFPGWLNCALFEGIRRDARWPAFQERLEHEFFRGEQRPLAPARSIILQAWPRAARG